MIKTFLAAFLLCVTAKAALYREVQLSGSNTVFMASEINTLSVNKDMGDIMGKRLLLPQAETLYIVLVSPGGSVPDGVVLANFIAQMPNVQLICIYCASMAGAIFEMVPVKRLVLEKSNIMMHEMRISASAKVLTPKLLKNFKKQSDIFNKLFYTKLNWSKAKYEQLIENSEINMDGFEMVKGGLADEIIIIKCDQYLQSFAPRTCG